MDPPDRKLCAKARRAYELGRVSRALEMAAMPMAMVLLALFLGAGFILVLATGIALVVGTAVSYWYGRGPAEGAKAAVVGGTAAFAWPLMVRLAGACPAAHCDDLCTVASFFGGVSGGIVLLAFDTLRRLEPTAIATAIVLVGSAGVLGATFADARGLIASATGLGLAASTLILVAPRPGT